MEGVPLGMRRPDSGDAVEPEGVVALGDGVGPADGVPVLAGGVPVLAGGELAAVSDPPEPQAVNESASSSRAGVASLGNRDSGG